MRWWMHESHSARTHAHAKHIHLPSPCTLKISSATESRAMVYAMLLCWPLTGGSVSLCAPSSLLSPLLPCVVWILVHIIRFSCVFMFGSQHTTFWFSTSSHKTLYLHHSRSFLVPVTLGQTVDACMCLCVFGFSTFRHHRSSFGEALIIYSAMVYVTTHNN